MPTLQRLINKIASDLHRSDLSTEITDAIDSAIRYYSRERFWWLEGSSTFTTSASQAWYTTPTDMKMLDTVMVTISGSKFPVDRVGFAEIEERDSNNLTGQPTQYAIYANQYRIYPTPDSAYVVTTHYHKSLDAPTASDSNAWTNTAFDLIRHRSRWDIAKHHLKDPEEAMMAKESENDEYFALLGETRKKISTGTIKKGGL